MSWSNPSTQRVARALVGEHGDALVLHRCAVGHRPERMHVQVVAGGQRGGERRVGRHDERARLEGAARRRMNDVAARCTATPSSTSAVDGPEGLQGGGLEGVASPTCADHRAVDLCCAALMGRVLASRSSVAVARVAPHNSGWLHTAGGE